MNYLAHLFLARPNADSYLGNLLGDFSRGIDPGLYPDAVRAGLANHRLVDKFTDAHPLVKRARQRFSPARRRFAGIALDVVFDHLLIRHWSAFSEMDFEYFCHIAYQRLASRQPLMPPRMQRVVGSMIEQHWFAHYRALDGVGEALDHIARRIRFDNSFAGCLQDIEAHYGQLEQDFMQFFPALREHVQQHGPEQASRHQDCSA